MIHGLINLYFDFLTEFLCSFNPETNMIITTFIVWITTQMRVTGKQNKDLCLKRKKMLRSKTKPV